ncbi:DUF885 domain-containing protein [Crossiella sp. SN42]|uniref:DUF885 domain-containing protein n=1 Tax=Crossiella sp. SN42 TaxID=2944808 RepID=UPI00207C2DE8|nr:DUF885 domain-containing protein [Crossiella sp. SN42]MCO1579789.1 DUF885 domain-containing protein [Crossiella sp. SN42]
MTEVGALADRLVEVLATEDPLNDLLDGQPGFQGLLPQISAAGQARTAAAAADLAAAATELAVSGPDAVTRDVLVQQAEAVRTRSETRLAEHTLLDLMHAPAVVALNRLPAARPATAEQEEFFLARIAGLPDFLAQAADRHREGVASGRLPVARSLRTLTGLLENYLAHPGQDPLTQAPLTGDRTARRERLLAEEVRPAVAAYRATLQEITGRPDEQPGLCWLPDGEANYTALARMHTTTERTPAELHAEGLRLLADLEAEFARLGGPLFGVRTGAEVRARLRTDPALKLRDGAELLALSRAAMDRAEAAAPRWFGRMPGHRCELRETPPDKAPTASTAAYLPPPLDGSRPGIYYANTYRVTERDRCVTEANAFHEAVPGHHFQLGLAAELTGLPALRRVAWVNAYMEGWALYCEHLAEEMGLYSGDLMRLGALANTAMRAARLVVDTGLHAFGWPRARVVAFLREHTAMTEVEIASETDRYIETPGQALSYLVGRMEFQRLRARAERELGADFDIRGFHDLVLGGGPLPLTVLDRVVDDWLKVVSRGSRTRSPGPARS